MWPEGLINKSIDIVVAIQGFYDVCIYGLWAWVKVPKEQLFSMLIYPIRKGTI